MCVAGPASNRNAVGWGRERKMPAITTGLSGLKKRAFSPGVWAGNAPDKSYDTADGYVVYRSETAVDLRYFGGTEYGEPYIGVSRSRGHPRSRRVEPVWAGPGHDTPGQPCS